MKMNRSAVCFWLVFMLCMNTGCLVAQVSSTACDLVRDMFKETEKVKNIVYVLRKGERIQGQLSYQESFTKVTYFPMKIYTRTLGNEGGEEILYVSGENKNRALVKPAGFPWTNLNLDPKGKLMRNNQHHTLLDAGYIKVIPIIQYQFQQFPDKIESMFRMGTSCKIGGAECYTVIFENSAFGWETYTPGPGETLFSLAEKRRLSEWMIIEKNPDLHDFWTPVVGLPLKIPTVYALKMELFIEKDRKILRGFKVFDDDGLFEHFEFKELDINQPLGEDDFSRDAAEYGF